MKPLFRFVRAKYADDFSGEGSRLVGGRWSPVGIPVLYVVESAALGALEFLVHMAGSDNRRRGFESWSSSWTPSRPRTAPFNFDRRFVS